MDTKTASAILEHFKETTAISKWIRDRYVKKYGSRLRRGPIQKKLAKDLGFTLNPDYHERIKKAFTDLGIRHIKVNGKPYYGELQLKEEIENAVV